ncbi:MAG: hypothetical protein HWN67_12160 [Candidatus Helarchaeota archaeon]|nr:hypothetical protein [Candidatus Helarchaeota archaeon]
MLKKAIQERQRYFLKKKVCSTKVGFVLGEKEHSIILSSSLMIEIN